MPTTHESRHWTQTTTASHQPSRELMATHPKPLESPSWPRGNAPPLSPRKTPTHKTTSCTTLPGCCRTSPSALTKLWHRQGTTRKLWSLRTVFPRLRMRSQPIETVALAKLRASLLLVLPSCPLGHPVHGVCVFPVGAISVLRRDQCGTQRQVAPAKEGQPLRNHLQTVCDLGRDVKISEHGIDGNGLNLLCTSVRRHFHCEHPSAMPQR